MWLLNYLILKFIIIIFRHQGWCAMNGTNICYRMFCMFSLKPEHFEALFVLFQNQLSLDQEIRGLNVR